MDFKIHERFEKRAPPQEVAAALSKYLEGIQ
jgi:hypothetical protein